MRNPICKKYIRTSAVIQCNTASDNISAESLFIGAVPSDCLKADTVLLRLSDKQVAFRYLFLLDVKSSLLKNLKSLFATSKTTDPEKSYFIN